MKRTNLKLAAGEGGFEAVRNQLTREEAGRLAEGLAFNMDGDSEDIARLILLCRSLAYEYDDTAREELLGAIETKAGILLPDFDRAIDAATRRQLAKLRKGGQGRG